MKWELTASFNSKQENVSTKRIKWKEDNHNFIFLNLFFMLISSLFPDLKDNQ